MNRSEWMPTKNDMTERKTHPTRTEDLLESIQLSTIVREMRRLPELPIISRKQCDWTFWKFISRAPPVLDVPSDAFPSLEVMGEGYRPKQIIACICLDVPLNPPQP